MRTTLTINDMVYEEIIRYSREANLSIKDAVNSLLQSGLTYQKTREKEHPFQQKSFSMGSGNSQYNLDKALDVASDLEAAEIRHKLDLRK